MLPALAHPKLGLWDGRAEPPPFCPLRPLFPSLCFSSPDITFPGVAITTGVKSLLTLPCCTNCTISLHCYKPVIFFREWKRLEEMAGIAFGHLACALPAALGPVREPERGSKQSQNALGRSFSPLSAAETMWLQHEELRMVCLRQCSHCHAVPATRRCRDGCARLGQSSWLALCAPILREQLLSLWVTVAQGQAQRFCSLL